MLDKHDLSLKKMKTIINGLTAKLLKIAILISLTNTVGAQQTAVSKQPPANPNIKNLKIGDKVPDILMAKIINYKNKQARMNDFKNQLLILDFWDTYCSNCIIALPKLDSLQQVFGSKIQMMPVTYQPEALVSTFFQKNAYVKNLQLPCVVEDKILRAYFKHQLISHEVWIYKGVVKAITGTEYVTAANIQKVLNGETINWPVKDDDFRFDSKKPLFSLNEVNKYNKQSEFNNHSGMTGYRSGIDYTSGVSYDSVAHRTYFYNFSVIDAYKTLLTGIDRKNFLIGPSRMILEVKDPSKYVYNDKSGFQNEWNEKYQFCYEMVNAKPMDKKERLKMIVNDLNNRLSLNGRFEKRLTKCLVFVKTPDNKLIDTVSQVQGAVSISDIAFFNVDYSFNGKYPPTIDETNFKGSIKLAPYDGSLEGLRKEMQRHGFDIIEANREIEVLVITETN